MADLTAAHGGRRRAMVTVTSLRDGFEHLVPDETMTIEHAGQYRALCGHRVLAAVLAYPSGPPCVDCRAVQRSADTARHRRAPQVRWWTRLTTRLRRRHRPVARFRRDTTHRSGTR